MRPKHREENLVVKSIDGELLIYDLNADKAHSLNDVSALVFEWCDGEHDVDALADRLANLRGVSHRAAKALVELALEQLSHRNLLVEALPRLAGNARVSRRQMLRHLVAAGVGIAIIVSLNAPWPAAASSCRHAGGSCTQSIDCCDVALGAICLNGVCSSSN